MSYFANWDFWHWMFCHATVRLVRCPVSLFTSRCNIYACTVLMVLGQMTQSDKLPKIYPIFYPNVENTRTTT